jgi:hypothetical protein
LCIANLAQNELDVEGKYTLDPVSVKYFMDLSKAAVI